MNSFDKLVVLAILNDFNIVKIKSKYDIILKVSFQLRKVVDIHQQAVVVSTVQLGSQTKDLFTSHTINPNSLLKTEFLHR